MITKNISQIGIINKRIELKVKKFDLSKVKMSKESIDNANPRKYDPLSPISIFAGLKLYLRNPKLAPVKEAHIIANSTWPFIKLIRNTPNEKINDIPEANPSKPSIQLIELIIPTIQREVKIELMTLGKITLSKKIILEKSNPVIFIPK